MKSFRTALIVVLALMFIGTSSPDAAANSLRMGAGQQGSQNYGVNAALAQMFQMLAGINMSVQSFGGPATYLPLLHTGELDVASVVMPDLGDAIRGQGPFQGFPMTNIRLVASLFSSPVGILVAADSDIHSIADLKGRRFAWGLSAQPSLVAYAEGALANGGLTPSDVRLVPVASVANGVDELISGRVDATLFALRGGKVVEADSALNGIRWLPFDNSPEAVKAMQAAAPDSYLVEILPEDDVLGITSPQFTMAYDYVLAVGAHVSDDLVEQMAQVLADHGEFISETHSVLGDIDTENLYRPYPDLPYHDAALQVLQ